MRERRRERQARLTFLQRSSLVLLQPLDCDGFKAHPGSRILLEHVPHVLLAEDEEVRVADRAHAGCSPVTCVDVAIYWLSGCIKLSYVTAPWSICRSFRRFTYSRPALISSIRTHVVPVARSIRLHARVSYLFKILLRCFIPVYKRTVILINRVRYGSVFYVNWSLGRSARFPDFFREVFNRPAFVGW